MRKPIVFTNIADQATDEAFNIQVRQFINFLVERIDEMMNCFQEFDEHEIQSELRETASEALKQYQLRWRILDYLRFGIPISMASQCSNWSNRVCCSPCEPHEAM
jgi:hypothetical protein